MYNTEEEKKWYINMRINNLNTKIITVSSMFCCSKTVKTLFYIFASFPP